MQVSLSVHGSMHDYYYYFFLLLAVLRMYDFFTTSTYSSCPTPTTGLSVIAYSEHLAGSRVRGNHSVVVAARFPKNRAEATVVSIQYFGSQCERALALPATLTRDFKFENRRGSAAGGEIRVVRQNFGRFCIRTI